MSSPFPKEYKLNNGLTCPIIGQGTHGVKDVISQVVYQSIKDGVRFLDCAFIYNDEKEVGDGIKKAIADGLCKREDLFIVSKLWTENRADIEGEMKRTLEKLQLDYVDLYLDHWPVFFYYDKGKKITSKPMHVMWAEFESLVKKGYTKSIGVSNYNVQSLQNLLSFCEIKPAFNEVEFHPYLYQKDLLDFCEKEGIKLIGYNPICRGAYVNIEKSGLNLLEEPVIKELAAKYKKTPGQIALNWQVHCGVIPIPRTGKPERMRENLGSVEFKMDDADYEKVTGLNRNHRFNNFTEFPGINIFA